MAENPIRTAAAATAGLVTGTLLETIVKRFGFVLNVGETLSGFDFAVGEPPLLVHYAVTGYDYFLDTTDTTTVDDGLTCLVSGNGLRYHIEDAAAISRNSVLSIETAPPGAPVVGDVYRVNAAATGAFAGHDDDLAVWTRRGWVFATPEIGLTVFNEDTETNQQFTASGWTGFAVDYANGSVPPRALLKAAGIPVESTLNTPPGSPAADTFWLVGTVPTGAFVGHAGDIAFFETAAWDFIDAYEGATVFHKDFGFPVHYVSGAWLGGTGSDFQEFSTAGGPFTWTKPSKGNVALIEVWAGGGSGGRTGASENGGAGGGGGYVRRFMPLSLLGATEAVTVGAGGAARTSGDLNGNPGGSTSFGSHAVAYGGGGGGGTGSTSGGGGGGGDGAVGSTSSSGVGGAGGADFGGSIAAGGSGAVGSNSEHGGGGGGGGVGSGSGFAGGISYYGGGGGGGGQVTGGGVAGAGGKSGYGGAGGGGSGGNTSGAGGTSLYGGNGGGGASSSVAATAGSQPGGGGGGSRDGNSGKGGDGRVRVTVW